MSYFYKYLKYKKKYINLMYGSSLNKKIKDPKTKKYEIKTVNIEDNQLKYNSFEGNPYENNKHIYTIKDNEKKIIYLFYHIGNYKKKREVKKILKILRNLGLFKIIIQTNIYTNDTNFKKIMKDLNILYISKQKKAIELKTDRKAYSVAKVKAEADARRKADSEAKAKAEADARRKADSKLKAEEKKIFINNNELNKLNNINTINGPRELHYYDIPICNKKIILLGEWHTNYLKCNNKDCIEIDKLLNIIFSNESICFDYFIEDTPLINEGLHIIGGDYYSKEEYDKKTLPKLRVQALEFKEKKNIRIQKWDIRDYYKKDNLIMSYHNILLMSLSSSDFLNNYGNYLYSQNNLKINIKKILKYLIIDDYPSNEIKYLITSLIIRNFDTNRIKFNNEQLKIISTIIHNLDARDRFYFKHFINKLKKNKIFIHIINELYDIEEKEKMNKYYKDIEIKILKDIKELKTKEDKEKLLINFKKDNSVEIKEKLIDIEKIYFLKNLEEVKDIKSIYKLIQKSSKKIKKKIKEQLRDNYDDIKKIKHKIKNIVNDEQILFYSPSLITKLLKIRELIKINDKYIFNLLYKKIENIEYNSITTFLIIIFKNINLFNYFIKFESGFYKEMLFFKKKLNKSYKKFLIFKKKYPTIFKYEGDIRNILIKIMINDDFKNRFDSRYPVMGLLTAITDVYTFFRMFTIFDKNKNRKCNNINEPQKVIMYGGTGHINFMNLIFQKFSKNIIKKTTIITDKSYINFNPNIEGKIQSLKELIIDFYK